MALNSRFCNGYLTIKPRKSQKGRATIPRQSTNNVYHVQNAFHKAVEAGDLTQAKVLLRYAQMNIHLNEPNRNGRTALQECCLKDEIEIMRLLVDNGASIEATDSYGWTTLHYAAFFGSLEIVRFLVLNCADLTAVNNSGETPYDIAQNEDVKFYIQGMTMLKKDDSVKDDDDDDDEDDDVDDDDDDYYSDDRSWRNESDSDSIGNSIDVKLAEEIDKSDSHDTIDTGYEGETPPSSPTRMQPFNRRKFGYLRQNGPSKYVSSPRKQEIIENESNNLLEIVNEDEFIYKATSKVGKIEEEEEDDDEEEEEEVDDEDDDDDDEEEEEEEGEGEYDENGEEDYKKRGREEEEKQKRREDDSENMTSRREEEEQEQTIGRKEKEGRNTISKQSTCKENTVVVGSQMRFGFHKTARQGDSKIPKSIKLSKIEKEKNIIKRPSGIPRWNKPTKEKVHVVKSIDRRDRAYNKNTNKKGQNNLLKDNYSLMRMRRVSSEPDIKNVDDEDYFQKPTMKKMANVEKLNMIEDY